jgi:dTDP-4-dehydrorhamnose 3,5-epimerase
MKELNTGISGLKLLEPRVFRDDRGFFLETFRADKFEELGIPTSFPQDNHSRSAAGVLRGLHFQVDPPQGKLVSVARGRIFDVAVDLRRGSATFGKWFGTELNDTNKHMLWIPFGFAHGFCVLGEEPADVIYKTTGVYNAKTEGGVRWNDSEIGVKWPVNNPLVSARDNSLPSLREVQPL